MQEQRIKSKEQLLTPTPLPDEEGLEQTGEDSRVWGMRVKAFASSQVIGRWKKENSVCTKESGVSVNTLFMLIFLSLFLTGCSANWGWYVVNPATKSGMNNLQFLFSGLYYTVLLSLTAILISVVVGLLIALPGLSKNPLLRSINRVYVEVIRAIPILVLILWVYYGLPQVADISISVFWAGVIALALSDSAFQAEIFRAGIQSINRGQYEAAHSISLNYRDTMRYVILPQAIKRILPALGNQLVYMLKMSSLVSVIGMQELTRKANELVVTEYRPLEIYTILVLEYLVLILVVSAGVRWLERRMQTDER